MLLLLFQQPSCLCCHLLLLPWLLLMLVELKFQLQLLQLG